jgi:glycine oxidase
LKHHKKVDYIIIGQGLAGSCLALQLIFRNKSLAVFDQPLLNHCTAVAAGLFNPITGKMLAKSWQADTLFPYLHSFYLHAENHLKRKFFYPMPLYRPFNSVEEQNEWMGRSTHASMKEYIANIFLNSVYGSEVRDPVGGVLLKHGGYVDTAAFTESVRSLLKNSDSYREEKLDEAELNAHDLGISYRDLIAKKIVYCGGVSDLNSRYFSWLPIKPLKGETLLIHMAVPERIYNRGVYIVPGNRKGEFNVGATYDFDLTPAITYAGKAELETKLNELIRLPYSISHQNWGIRPTTPDRRILLGPHPSHPNIVIFNGLGTKGISLAPYFSGQLAQWLAGEGEIGPEVNIQRFKSLYFEV